MKLFYAPGACSLADHIALAEAGLDYTLDKVDLKAKKTESGGDYLAVNPKGYVPALQLDDGDTLTENIAVLSYIADRAPALQEGGSAKWHVLEAAAFISTEIHKAFKPFHKPDSSDAQKDEARTILGQRFGTAADMLGGRDFLVGERLTVADCYLFVMLLWAERFGLDVPQALAGYRDRLKERPAFARALREEGLA